MVDEWRHDRVPDLAAEVAFWSVLSLVPALLSMAAVLGLLDSVVGADVAIRVQENLLDALRSILSDEADGTLESVERLFDDTSPGLFTFSLLAAVWAVTRGFAALVRALDVAYDLDEHRPWVKIRSTAALLGVGSLVAAAVMLALLVIGPLLGTGDDVAETVGLGDTFVVLWDVLRLPVAFVLLVVWAATIFHIAPDHHTPWKADVPGALLTTVLWIVFSGGLRIYVEVAQQSNSVFGALGGVLIVMLWFWLLSLAVILGGELNQIVLEQRDDGSGSPVGVVEGLAQSGHELAGGDGAPAVEQDPHDRRGHDDAV